METLSPNQKRLCTLLTDGMGHLIKVYRMLLDNIRNEKDLLIKADIEKLAENNKAKEIILLKLRTFENARMKVAKDLAMAVGADHEQPRLLDIASRLSTSEGNHLRNQHSVLDLLIKRLNEINKENEQLAHAALKNVSGAIGAIRDSLAGKPVYEKKGNLSKTGVAGKIVSCEA
ncbi:MAG: flagellar protein FlgN [Pseudomonadota bacterium]|nr:flagellar protein FlgN [Pseudomonadota bacterium]